MAMFLLAASVLLAVRFVSDAVSPRMEAEVEMSLSSMAPATILIEVMALVAIPPLLTCVKAVSYTHLRAHET